MKIIQFTDIHLTTPGKTIGERDPNANFERALAHALDIHPDAEALVITGDLSDWGEEEDYRRLRTRLEDVAIPVHLCIGNHDDRMAFLSVFPELADPDGFVQKVFALSEGTGVIIDTWGPETHAGHFCELRASWLERMLGALEGPVYLFMHHNPVPTHIAPKDRIMLLDADRLGAVVARHRQRLRHIFFGHCHLPLSGSFHGVPVSAIRGTNHAAFPNFPERRMLTRSELPEAYGVIIADGPSVTVHMVEFGHTGKLSIEGSPDYAAWEKTDASR